MSKQINHFHLSQFKKTIHKQAKPKKKLCSEKTDFCLFTYASIIKNHPCLTQEKWVNDLLKAFQ